MITFQYGMNYKLLTVVGMNSSCINLPFILQKSVHNQGDTISCLAGNVTSLKASCQRQILRVAELQSNDYHNDRQLFLACQDDREKFCANVNSGDGKTYRCLAAHKFDQRMSKQVSPWNILTMQSVSRDEGFIIRWNLCSSASTCGALYSAFIY